MGKGYRLKSGWLRLRYYGGRALRKLWLGWPGLVLFAVSALIFVYVIAPRFAASVCQSSFIRRYVAAPKDDSMRLHTAPVAMPPQSPHPATASSVSARDSSSSGGSGSAVAHE